MSLQRNSVVVGIIGACFTQGCGINADPVSNETSAATSSETSTTGGHGGHSMSSASTGGEGGAGGDAGSTAATGGGGSSASSASTGGSGGCSSNEKDCNGSCVPKDQPQTGCAAPSCTPCSFANATAKCDAGGACALDSCNADFGDCDGDPSTGCETDLRTTKDHCGACTNACTNAHDSCVAKACTNDCKVPTSITSDTMCGHYQGPAVFSTDPQNPDHVGFSEVAPTYLDPYGASGACTNPQDNVPYATCDVGPLTSGMSVRFRIGIYDYDIATQGKFNTTRGGTLACSAIRCQGEFFSYAPGGAEVGYCDGCGPGTSCTGKLSCFLETSSPKFWSVVYTK